MQHLLLLAILLLGVGGWMLTRNVKLGSDVTFSLHAATSRRAMILFASVLTVAVGLLWVFMTGWFAPHFQFGKIYGVLVTISTLCVLTTAWIPDTTGVKRRVHRLAAYGIVLTMPLLIAPLLVVDISVFIRSWTGVVLAALIIMCGLLFFEPRARKYFLTLQAVYIGLFFSVLLLATYLT